VSGGHYLGELSFFDVPRVYHPRLGTAIDEQGSAQKTRERRVVSNYKIRRFREAELSEGAQRAQEEEVALSKPKNLQHWSRRDDRIANVVEGEVIRNVQGSAEARAHRRQRLQSASSCGLHGEALAEDLRVFDEELDVPFERFLREVLDASPESDAGRPIGQGPGRKARDR
jgi:hypothetical protein